MTHYQPPPPNYAPKPTSVLRWKREYYTEPSKLFTGENGKPLLYNEHIRLVLQQWWHDPATDKGEWRPISEED